MARVPVSVTIITLNEEKNLARALNSVSWAEEILVVDSGSTDSTVETARRMGARVLSNPWFGYGKQKNFAQANAANDWVLNIDADEELSPALSSEIRQALENAGNPGSGVAGYRFPRKTFYLGRWILHGGWYPNRLVRLVNRRHASWTEPGVHEELVVNGGVEDLRGDLNHYTFRSIQDQVLTNLNFARLGSQELRRQGQGPGIAKLLYKPVGKFIETYIIKCGFLDGLAGLIISVNAAHSMFLKYAFLFESDTGNAHPDN